ncbi:hypothetical protein [Nitrosopumilus sp.]|uniref:hypothetical protein n=1 Tax=Nitrosopumilus sp. TaxID=2024843 RepID=UPI0029303055|nr:hypothetical protein [Nitrosopumilus sp.]
MKHFIIFAVLITSIIFVTSYDSVFASHGNPSHHEKVEHHKQQAMQYDEQCRADQSLCDHAQAAGHHVDAAMNCHETGDHNCSSVHYSEAARHYKESNDQTNYLKHNAYSLHHKGITKHGDSYVLPPRHQIHIVDSPQDIQCKQTHELIFKSNNSQPLCVSHSTASHLVEKGWAHY